MSDLALSHIGTDRQCSVVRADGSQCRKVAIKDGTVCTSHGGWAQMKRLNKEKLREQLRKFLQSELGAKIKIDPAEALLRSVWEAAGNVVYLRRRIQMLNEHPLGTLDDDGYADMSEALYGPDHLGDLAPHVLLKMYNEERDRLVRYSKIAVDAGIAERAVRLAERQGEMLAQVVNAVLEHPDLQLNAQQRQIGREVASERLRLVGEVIEGNVAVDDFPDVKIEGK